MKHIFMNARNTNGDFSYKSTFNIMDDLGCGLEAACAIITSIAEKLTEEGFDVSLTEDDMEEERLVAEEQDFRTECWKAEENSRDDEDWFFSPNDGD